MCRTCLEPTLSVFSWRGTFLIILAQVCYKMSLQLKTYLYSSDAAGVDLEQLDPVPDATLNPPAWIHRTHIFCLKYDAKARSKISYHFHSLVNHCHTELCPMDFGIEHYTNCAVLSLTTDKVYRCVLLHSKQMNLIEVQILKFSHENGEIDDDIKIRLSSTITDYLDTYFENVTSFEKYLRCEKSAWQDQHGLWACKQLQLTVAMEIPCDHGNNMADTHTIRPKELLNQWPVFHSETDRTGHLLGAVGYNSNPGCHKQPTEHSDFHSEENSYHFSTLNALSTSTSPPGNTTIKTEARSENNSFKMEFKAKQTSNTGRGHTYTLIDAKRPEISRVTQERGVQDDTSNSFVSFTKSIDFNTIETDIVRPKEYNFPSEQSISKVSETTELSEDTHRNPATQNLLNKFSKTAKEPTESSFDSKESPRVVQERALENKDLANSFVTFTNSIGTNIVRPNEYNIPSQQSTCIDK